MGIMESDLQYLPFTEMRWRCVVEGCKCWGRARDYGISPFFWDPSKKKLFASGRWRGGWFDVCNHMRVCSKHGKLYDRLGHDGFENLICKAKLTDEYLLQRVIPKPQTKKK